jgi:hypothetical protein
MCDCCGTGLLEIKCPYTYCNKDLPGIDSIEDEDLSKFCMERDDEGCLFLLENHQYYYQVQAQMNICKQPYCDFVVWNGKQDPIIRRVWRDVKFFNTSMVKVEHFIKYGMLPELVGKWLTRKVHADEDGVVQLLQEPASTCTSAEDMDMDDENTLYCYCAMPALDTMLVCGNKKCTLKKFHMECLRVRCPPKGKAKWYCPHCRRLPQFNRSKKSRVYNQNEI